MLNEKMKKKVKRAMGGNQEPMIQRSRRPAVAFEVTGTAPLIQHRFDEKTILEMLRKHMGYSVEREKKKPREVIERAKVLNTDGKICMPPQAFKAAMLTASLDIKTLKTNRLKTQIFIRGSSIPITYESETPRMDMVRTSGMARQPDVRFRPQFDSWRARMVIEHSDFLQPTTIMDLLDRAGDVGVGEWRPQKNGTFGTFYVSRHITLASEIAEIIKECSVPIVPVRIPEWALDALMSPEELSEVMASQEGEENDEDEVEERGSGRKRKSA